jgi:phosphoglycerate kinase
VLVRVDFNTPVAEIDGRLEVTDDFRIRATIPLFEELLAKGATIVACTHFGRPKGQVVEKYSVAPVRRRLAELCPEVELMENLRFNPGEEADDPAFGASLVAGFDYYINEAFSASHRAHASIMIPPTLIPSAAGPNLQREVSTLSAILEDPARPFVAIVGGAKVKDKLGIVKVLSEKADQVIVGGGMAYTFEAPSVRRSLTPRTSTSAPNSWTAARSSSPLTPSVCPWVHPLAAVATRKCSSGARTYLMVTRASTSAPRRPPRSVTSS